MSESLIKTPTTFGENGNFLLERELGMGGMGGVYMGRDKMLDRAVAVKVMQKEYGSDAEFVEKFKREAQAAARLIHPNIAQIYSYGICDGMPYIAMELAAGGSLYTIMNAAPGKTDITRVMKIGQQVAQALQCASDLGFVHGDVKPENILLDANGNAKLVDFGLAAMQKDTSEIWGTPYYISPEKVQKTQIDFRADMYSLGGTLYHALTGVAPFEGDDSVAVIKKRFEGMPKKPSEVRAGIPPAIDALVMKMLAFKREDRYPTFEALVQAFKEVMTTGFTEKMPKPSGSKPVLPKRMTIRKPNLTATPTDKPAEAPEEEDEGANIGRKVALFVGGGILVVGAVIGSLVWFQHADKAAQERERATEISSGIAKAREAIKHNREITVRNGEEFAAMCEKAVAECEKITKELAGLMPEIADSLKPAPTNGVEGVVAPKEGLPEIVESVHDLWYRAYDCQTSAEEIKADVAKVVEECDKLGAMNETSEAALKTLGEISERTKELHDKISGSKSADTLRKGAGYIESKGKKLVDQTVKKLRIEKLEAERKAKAEAAAAAEKARQEELAAKKQALIESESAESVAKFEAIASQGCLRQLDWKSALRQLETMKAEFKTAEGQLAADLQIHKVNAMKKVQDVFVKELKKGYAFKSSKLKGAKVTAVDEAEMKLAKGDGSSQKIQWAKFYKEYPSNLNELINGFVVDGRKNASLNLKEWADAMTGAALTMRIVCGEVTGAAKRAEWIAQETVRQFPDFAKTAREIFPDLTFAASEE